MAIVVIGGGAIGLLVAGRLRQAGEPVALLARPAGVAALHSSGLTLAAEGRVAHIEGLAAAAAPEALPAEWQRPELAILCVKGYDTEGTLPALASLEPTHIATLQNGIGNEETLAGRFGAARVVSGIITSSVVVKGGAGDGLRIEVTKAGGVGFAPVDAANGMPGAACCTELFGRAGFDARQYGDYRTLKWSKALLNMLGNGTAAVLDMPPEVVYSDRRLFALERQLASEALAVMRRRGIRAANLPRYPAALLARAVRLLPTTLLQPILKRAIAGGRGGKAPSLLGDLQRGRSRSEGASLYGAVAAAAAESGVPAPANAALWAALSGIAEGSVPWERFRHTPEALLGWVEGFRRQEAVNRRQET